MNTAIRRFERIVVGFLLVMMAFVVVLSAAELLWILAHDVLSPPVFFLEVDELLGVFGIFLLVLIGLELFEVMLKTYLQEQVDRVEVVLIVAMIAIARKVIVVDFEDADPLTAVGVGALVIALAGGHYLFKLSRRVAAGTEAGNGPGERLGPSEGQDREAGR